MGFFSDDPKGIKGASGMKKLDRDIRETMHSSGIFGGTDQVKFVHDTFDVFAKNSAYEHNQQIKWGNGVIEPHEAEEAFKIIEQGADKYHIKPEQIAKLREHLKGPLSQD
jgi:hypothetical protein